MGARYYNATEGRFISPDPFGHAASMDLYSFANGDPVNFVDPTGRQSEDGRGDGVISTQYTVNDVLNSVGIQTGNIGLNTNIDAINSLSPSQGQTLMGMMGRQPYVEGGPGVFGGELTSDQAHGLNKNSLNFGVYKNSDNGQLLQAYTAGMTLLTEFQADASTGVGLFSLGKAGAAAITSGGSTFAEGAFDVSQMRYDVAEAFYKNNTDWSDPVIAGHLSGINFSKPVTEVRVPAGDNLVQFGFPGSDVGNYFASPGTPSTGLGIYPSGRVESVLEAVDDLRGLQSTAADITDTWSIPSWDIEVRGGNTQIFIPNH